MILSTLQMPDFVFNWTTFWGENMSPGTMVWYPENLKSFKSMSVLCRAQELDLRNRTYVINGWSTV